MMRVMIHPCKREREREGDGVLCYSWYKKVHIDA